jgi:formate dehydrogenase family accessory protein FdhD
MRDAKRVGVLKLKGHETSDVEDDVVVEEPLEIRVNNCSAGVTMRTPGHDFDLAAGFLWTESYISGLDEIGTIAYCPDEEHPELRNVVNVTLVDTRRQFESPRRAWSSSSCGLCGKSTLDAIRRTIRPCESPLTISRDVLLQLPEKMLLSQPNFSRTGGIHAAALFDPLGKLILIREDLGRHNAVDKVLGAALRERANPGGLVLVVSGRLGFEIAQKAAVAGIPVVASVSAPSSLAIELATDFGVTAAGFVRGNSMNIYSHPERVTHGISEHPA